MSITEILNNRNESGIICFPNGNDAILCNWSFIDGIPRQDFTGTGFIGLGEDLEVINRSSTESWKALVNGKEIVCNNVEDLNAEDCSAEVLELVGGYLIIAPYGWN